VAAPGAAQDETREKGCWERATDAFEQLDRKRAMEEAQRLYQQPEGGRRERAGLLEWAREDLARAGRWEYKGSSSTAIPATWSRT